MNLDTIKKTAICRYSTEEGGIYIVESPLLEIISGIAPTQSEAWEIFEDLAKAVYIEHLKGNKTDQYSRGRPSKGAVHVHVQIQPKTKSEIVGLGKKLHTSQGEAVDYLMAFYNAKNSEPVVHKNGGIKRTELHALEKQLRQVYSTVQTLVSSNKGLNGHVRTGRRKV